MSAITRVPVVGQMLFCSFLWATSFLVMKQLGIAFSPLALAAMRGVMAAALICLWIAASLGPHAILPSRREALEWTVLGLLQGLLPNVLTAFALTRINAGLSAMLQATAPLMVAALMPLVIPGHTIDRYRLGGIVLGFAGLALLIGPAATGGPVDLPGIAAMLATALSYAIGALYVRRAVTTDPRRLALGQQSLAGLIASLILIAGGGAGELALAADYPLELIAFGVFGTALPIVVFMHILRTAGPAVGSMNGYFLPPWTTLLGWLFLGEMISGREFSAMLIIFAGVVIASLRPADRAGS